MAEFQRPEGGYFFDFGGINTKDQPDQLAPNKFSAAQNIRATGAHSVRTRPGYTILFACSGGAVTDISSYTKLNTDSLPRLLARTAGGALFLDNGVPAGNLSGNAGFGVSMIPFRPAESSLTWMYVGGVGDYQKFSAPGSNNNNVTQAKVGIAEPQKQLEAAPQAIQFQAITNNNWAAGGTASIGGGNNRTIGVVVAALPDPVIATRYSVAYSFIFGFTFDPGQLIGFGANNSTVIIQDVIPPIGGNVSIQSILYESGNNGVCTITPSQLPIGELERGLQQIASLRRGAIVFINATEYCFVRGVAFGPNGLVSFTTSTNNTFTAGMAILGAGAIVVDTSPTPAGNINSIFTEATVGGGVGYISLTPSTNPFALALAPGNNNFAQQDDYFHLSLLVDNPAAVQQVLILLNIDSNNNNFTDNLFYAAVRQDQFANILGGNKTVIAATLQQVQDDITAELSPQGYTAPINSGTSLNQWLEVMVPISSLTRLGSNPTLTLAQFNRIRVQATVAANNATGLGVSSIWVGGGSQPDVGNNGAPYQYQAVPLASLTGVRGNPTPLMRYGVTPRRQSVLLKTSNLNSAYDPQIDTWEVSRFGGTIDTYRFLGTAPIGTDFIDRYFDDTTAASRAIEIDNTEPWPSVDVPWRVDANNATITAFGPFLRITASSFPASMNRWLPGTIFQIGGQDAYTLRARPFNQGNNTYLLEFQEVIGSGNQTPVFVLEPNVARNPLPYLWGPDENGFVFGVGDPLRPGFVSMCKQFTPDSVPTAHSLELCAPSEPLLGGEVISGVSLVASSLRWWALYFQQGAATPYTKGAASPFRQIEVAVGKRLAAPFAKCSDGTAVYFWGTDGINKTSGAAAVSLTDLDLYNLFPHGGTSGTNITRGLITMYAPDYSRAASFRLAIRSGILYALYRDSTNTCRCLIGEISGDTVAWSTDKYLDEMSAVYAIEQPSGTLEISPALFPAVIMGGKTGTVYKLQDLTNDGSDPANNGTGVGIRVDVYTREWNGGDTRSDGLWGDLFLDAFVASNVTATPVAGGISVAGATIIPANNNVKRQMVPVSTSGGVLAPFIGMSISWTDNFSNNNAGPPAFGGPTTLFAWQPSMAPQVETTADRAADWTDSGTPTNKWFQGFILDADTYGNNKSLLIQDADTHATHAIQPSPVNHPGRQTKPYSFVTPFLAHSVRDVPQDKVLWRKFGITYIYQPSPESAQTWETQWTGFGLPGYKHIPRVEFSYSSTAAVVLTILSFDGQSPTVLNLPSTAGVTKRPLLTLTFNKGQLYKFKAQSGAPFQVFLEDIVVWVMEWGRTGAGIQYKALGGSFGDKAAV